MNKQGDRAVGCPRNEKNPTGLDEPERQLEMIGERVGVRWRRQRLGGVEAQDQGEQGQEHPGHGRWFFRRRGGGGFPELESPKREQPSASP